MESTISPLVTLLANRNGAYIYLAICIATLYDHIISLDLEVDFIWKRPKFSLAQILFVINRYVGDAVLVYIATVLVMQANPQIVSDHFLLNLSEFPIFFSLLGDTNFYDVGDVLTNLSTWGGAIVIWSMQGIMVIRINVMYRDSFKVKSVLLAFFAVEIISMTIMQAIVPNQLTSLTCAVRRYPDWYEWLWVPILLFELLMFGLSIWAGCLHYRDFSYKAPILFSDEGRTIAYVMMRDSILFPFVSVVLVIVNFMAWNRFSVAAGQANTAIMIFAPRILGCRLILNLREVYYRPFGDEYSRDYANTISPIKFAITNDAAV